MSDITIIPYRDPFGLRVYQWFCWLPWIEKYRRWRIPEGQYGRIGWWLRVYYERRCDEVLKARHRHDLMLDTTGRWLLVPGDGWRRICMYCGEYDAWWVYR